MSDTFTTSGGGTIPPVTWTASGAAGDPIPPHFVTGLQQIKPNAWKRQPTDWIVWVLLAIAICAFVILGWIAWDARSRLASPITPSTDNYLLGGEPTIVNPPQPHSRITATTSTGGKESTKESAKNTGGFVAGDGDKVSLKDANLSPGTATLPGGASAAGGGATVAGLSAQLTGMQLWIRLLGLAVFVGCGGLAFLNFKKNPLDWHFWGGLVAGSLGGLVVLVQPDMWWIGLGGLAIAGFLNFFPSITGPRVLEASKNYEDFINTNPDIKERWVKFRASMPAADKNIIDTIIIPRNT